MRRFFSHAVLHVKLSFRDKGSLFWGFIYPVLLLTLMAVSFSGLKISQERVPIAVEQGSALAGALRGIDILDIRDYQGDAALTALRDKKIDGIYRADGTLLVRGKGMNETILREIGSQLKKVGAAFAAGHSPDFSKGYIARGDQDAGILPVILSASLGMFALYGYFSGVSIVHTIQANLSPLAVRVSTAPVSRLSFVCAGMATGTIMNVLHTVVLLLYLKWVWHVNYLSDIWRTLLLVLVTGFFGAALGLFVGASNRWPIRAKVPLGVALMLVLSAFSGMMGSGFRLFLDKTFPWINRFNPVNIFSRTIYRLNALGTTKDFSEAVLFFLAAGIVLCFVSLLFMRNRRFRSL
ncbi:MAG TPA: ABC transporter permease [Bacillota bacterium]|nr:ABC transporter permease [Bacillota bacterium]